MTKDWISYLSAAFRLVDLHDSARSFGSTPTSLKEERTGRRDGVWLHLACYLLSYLDECDLETNEGWNPIGPFVKDICGRHRSLNDDDVQLVISYLSTPTEVYFIKEEPNKGQLRVASTKDTALIERRSIRGQTDLCRLTQRGRLAITLAKASHNWLYTHHDADKLMTALLYGEFHDIPKQCASLGQSIRAFAHEITRTMEQPGQNEVIAHFLDRGNQYLDSIRKVQTAVQNAREHLGTAEVRERFNQWFEQNEGMGLDLGVMRRTLDELMQTVERLSRRFSAFLHQVTDTQREVVGAIPFEKAALAFVFQPPSLVVMDMLTGNLGAWLPEMCFGAPEDMQGILRAEIDRHQASQPKVFGEDAGATRERTVMELFVHEHREAMFSALKAGPVRLGTALTMGWAKIGDQCHLTELVGVYSAPSWLGRGADVIQLRIKPGSLDARVEGCTWLAGDDIEMQLVQEQGGNNGPE